MPTRLSSEFGIQTVPCWQTRAALEQAFKKNQFPPHTHTTSPAQWQTNMTYCWQAATTDHCGCVCLWECWCILRGCTPSCLQCVWSPKQSGRKPWSHSMIIFAMQNNPKLDAINTYCLSKDCIHSLRTEKKIHLLFPLIFTAVCPWMHCLHLLAWVCDR